VYLKTADDAYVNSHYVWKLWVEEVTPGSDYAIHAVVATKGDSEPTADVTLKGNWPSRGDAATEVEALIQRMHPGVYIGNYPRSSPLL
jgi:hypothetical protein